ncbi:hypothetical protein OpiT1DRAFT_00174 [Opitutaceae bacterium TAV1]|nr:hypothetical protein OpiT1DRAFT_00174 [Opitutaceae bacterium TAV1]
MSKLPNHFLENMRSRRVRRPKDAPPPAPEALAEMKAYARQLAVAHRLREHLWAAHRESVSERASYSWMQKIHAELHARKGDAAEDFEALPDYELSPPVAYVTPATGNIYLTAGKVLKGMPGHWHARAPVCCEFLRSSESTPLVDLGTAFGMGATYTPAQLRAIAATLTRIADDADAHPMGPRNFFRSSRGYRVEETT